MKGIVVDINNQDAVILADDGLFTKVRNEDYTIGQMLHIKERAAEGQPARESVTGEQHVKESWAAAGVRRVRESWKAGSKLLTGAASMAAVMAIGTIGAFAYYTPTDYVSLDVNPSIEYSINMFDRILKVNAVNDDGEEILSNLNLNNKNIQTGMKETLDQLIAEGYLADGPDDGVVIATSNAQQGEAERLAAELKQEVVTYLGDQKGVIAKVDAEAVGREKVEEAKELGVTPGKLNLVEKLEASTSGAIDREQWLTKPVKDINKTIKENWKTTGIKRNDPAWMTYNPYWPAPSNDRTQTKSQGKNQNQYQSRDQNNNQDQNKNQNLNPNWNWNQGQDKDKNQSKKQDQNQNQNKNKSNNQKSQGQSQFKYQNWTQSQNQNKNQDQNQDKDQNQTKNKWKNQRGDSQDNDWKNGWNQQDDNDQDNDEGQSGSRDDKKNKQ